MGRKLMRVPMDFDHPINVTWPGYLNEHYQKRIPCPHCIDFTNEPDGLSDYARMIQYKWYGYIPFKPEENGSIPYTASHPIILAKAVRNVEHAPHFYGTGETAIYREAVRLRDLFNSGMHYHLNDEQVAHLIEREKLNHLMRDWVVTDKHGEWVAKDPLYIPTAKEVNEREMEYSSGDYYWAILTYECKKANQSHLCAHCEGETYTWACPEDQAAYDNWERTEPPEGPGYQVWQTVSEGAPISPVFSTPQDLARHMTTTRWGADKGTSYEAWLQFCNDGYSFSMMSVGNDLLNGVEAQYRLKKEKSQ